MSLTDTNTETAKPRPKKSNAGLYIFLLIGVCIGLSECLIPVLDNLWDQWNLSFPIGFLFEEILLMSSATLTLWIATRVTGRRARPIPLSPPFAPLKGLVMGIGVGLLYAFVEILVLRPTKMVSGNFRILFSSLFQGSVLVLVLDYAIVAFWEERMWRGEILTALREKCRTRYALLISSAGFGLFHLVGGGKSDPFQQALMGLMFGAVFLLTDSLWAPIGLHFIHNLLIDLREGKPDYHIPAPPFHLADHASFAIQLFPLKISSGAFGYFFYMVLEPLLITSVMLLCWKIKNKRATRLHEEQRTDLPLST